MLEIEASEGGKRLDVVMSGRLDAVTADEFEDEVLSALGTTEMVTLDMGGVDYISSAGIRVLLLCARRMSSGGLTIKNVNKGVLEILEMAGLDGILPIE